MEFTSRISIIEPSGSELSSNFHRCGGGEIRCDIPRECVYSRRVPALGNIRLRELKTYRVSPKLKMVPFDDMVRRDIRVDRTIDFMSLDEGSVGAKGVGKKMAVLAFSIMKR